MNEVFTYLKTGKNPKRTNYERGNFKRFATTFLIASDGITLQKIKKYKEDRKYLGEEMM